MRAITVWQHVDTTLFREQILPLQQPAILQGLVEQWPLVRLARESAAQACSYLLQHANAQPVDAVLLAPDQHGRLGLDAGLSAFNFVRNRLPLRKIIEQLARYSHFSEPPALAAQSAPIADCLPGLLPALPMPLLDPAVSPRIWLGNAIVTPAHFDESHNIACCGAGRRRFTLFPPDQLANLYLGPLDLAPTNTPISLVDFAQPDFDRFPRFRQALDAALVAELAPGDAIYIPPLWWHHVSSLEPLNILINYWWRQDSRGQQPDSALGALWHAVLCLRQLPPAERRAWAGLFEHYIFGPAEAATAHLPAERHGMLGQLDATEHQHLRQRIAALLDG
ncbi:cupin-like domain-containing protein [Chitinimonas sp.]|uniref:cupin-like domain-containing protein n=1 Tax=Chitinimonas sp. TaxID=1934313 RepID=UPI0035B3F36E